MAPSRGRGGVQAGVARPAPETAEKPAAGHAPADDPEVTESRPAPEPDERPAEPDAEASDGRRERVVFGESDDLLSDVDTGVNENEFKW